MEILNQEPIMEMASNYQTLLIIFGITFIVSFAIAMVSNSWSLSGPIAAVVCITSLAGLFITGAKAPMVETGRYKYEIILDDSVPANEVYEKYEVIERRGDIWVLEDKE
jgi:hypothetical protein